MIGVLKLFYKTFLFGFGSLMNVEQLACNIVVPVRL